MGQGQVNRPPATTATRNTVHSLSVGSSVLSHLYVDKTGVGILHLYTDYTVFCLVFFSMWTYKFNDPELTRNPQVSGGVPCRPLRLGFHIHTCLHTHGRCSNYHVAANDLHSTTFLQYMEEVLMEAQPLVCICLAWLHYRQETASTVPPQDQLPSPGLVPLSPMLIRCCPLRRKLPHPVEWNPSSTGRL